MTIKISRAWLVDTAERVGFTFAEAFAASFGLEGLYALGAGHINWSAVRIAEQAGLAAVAALVKAMIASRAKNTTSPASLAPAVKSRPKGRRG